MAQQVLDCKVQWESRSPGRCARFALGHQVVRRQLALFQIWGRHLDCSTVKELSGTARHTHYSPPIDKHGKMGDFDPIREPESRVMPHMPENPRASWLGSDKASQKISGTRYQAPGKRASQALSGQKQWQSPCQDAP